MRNLRVSYGPVPAVRGVDLVISPGEIVCVLGPNGAGKTSLLAGLSGLVRSRADECTFFGADVRSRNAAQRARLGLVHVPEGRRLFSAMTVEENLELGAHRGREPRGVRRRELDEIYERFPRLHDLRRRRAGLLSGGEQQLVALARALAMRPRLLLLDEPSLGLAPIAVEAVYDALAAQRERSPDLMIVLVEQSASWALELASRAYSMREGHLVDEGASSDLLGGDRLTELYLGSGARGTAPIRPGVDMSEANEPDTYSEGDMTMKARMRRC